MRDNVSLMKRILLTLAALLTLGGIGSAQWLTDSTAALAQAREKNRPVLIEFTGSDWCPGCIQLDRAVFQTEAFQKYAAENLVLLKVDFPRKPLSAAQRAHNEKLRLQYKVQGFPTIVVLKSDGTLAGTFFPQVANTQAFIRQVEKTAGKR